MVWKHLKLIALLMALTIFAHDGAMAGDAHHVSVAPVETLVSLEREPHSSKPHHQHAPTEPDQSDPESDCGTVTEASPLRPGYAHPDTPGSCLPPSPERPHARSRLAIGAIAPDHPPDVRRALLQVFLN